ncbi:MAG TPA: uroporphyrinogen decarboxylase family protein [Blastocatellia bacterium]|nr:uroporphyrinogen decarboxylase family protein [Blastocatellia bacterium]
MNKIERVTSALKGEEADRPPFSFWYHFGLQHRPGRDHAKAEIDFYRAYDLDFLKVMSDYPYPLPPGLEAIETKDDWKRIEPVSGTSPCWDEQFSALEMINDEIGNEAMFIETIFSPWTTARRLARAGGVEMARKRSPEILLAAMDSIATTLADFAKESVKRGASGIFLSLGAASADVMTADEYAIWGRPFDLRILEAVRDARFNVLHIHGKRIHFDSILDYPAAAFNWSHFATAPSLGEGKTRSGKTVLGGVDESVASHVSPSEIHGQIATTISEVGTRGLIVTPGCSVPTDTREASLRAIQASVERTRNRAQRSDRGSSIGPTHI